jgi:hypothetical protein
VTAADNFIAATDLGWRLVVRRPGARSENEWFALRVLGWWPSARERHMFPVVPVGDCLKTYSQHSGWPKRNNLEVIGLRHIDDLGLDVEIIDIE